MLFYYRLGDDILVIKFSLRNNIVEIFVFRFRLCFLGE